jgi:hypothetical protein
MQWRKVHDDLCDFASALTSGGKPLPLLLQKYIVAAAKSGGRSGGLRGRDPYGNSRRNSAIANAVYTVSVISGYPPTRNDATNEHCACSIVAQALHELDATMSVANVSAIWRESQRRLIVSLGRRIQRLLRMLASRFSAPGSLSILSFGCLLGLS